MKKIELWKMVVFAPCVLFLMLCLYLFLLWAVVNPLRLEKARQCILESDLKSLLDASGRLIATFNEENNLADGSIFDSRTYRAEDGFPSEMPEEIKALKPLYVTVERNRLIARLYAAPRIAMIVHTDNEQEDGATQITNRLWLYPGVGK